MLIILYKKEKKPKKKDDEEEKTKKSKKKGGGEECSNDQQNEIQTNDQQINSTNVEILKTNKKCKGSGETYDYDAAFNKSVESLKK